MKIDTLILFGGNRDKENGPMHDFIRQALQKKFHVILFTDSAHLQMKTKDDNRFIDILKKEEKNGLKWFEVKKLTLSQLKKYVTSSTIGISINSSWFFNKKMIELFKRNLYNYHNTRLPLERGAGAFTWRILSQNRLGGLTMHKMNVTLDTGDIILQKKFVFPKNCKLPKDYYDYIFDKETIFFSKFLDKIKNGLKFRTKPNLNKHSTYWPKLDTKNHGYIDWNWDAKEIELFICAFDDPYFGASTFLDGNKIFIKKCKINPETMKFHPFQSGIIFRKNEEKIFVAAKGGSLIIYDVFDENYEKITSKIKLGHRFFTPTKILEKAKTYRPRKQTQNYKTKISKS